MTTPPDDEYGVEPPAHEPSDNVAAEYEAHSAPSMVHRVVRASLRQPLIVLLLSATLVLVGAWSLTRLPVDAYPDISPPMVEIVTQWPGHAAEEIEQQIVDNEAA